MSALRPDRCARCAPGQDALGLCDGCLRDLVEVLRTTLSSQGGELAAALARIALLEDALFHLTQKVQGMDRRWKATEATP